jgi:hypothetical protein
MTLVRVVAPHFCAGLIMVDGHCTEAAPILAWARGKDTTSLRKYFADRGWKASVLPGSRDSTEHKE